MKSTSVILEEAKSAKAVLCSLDTKTKNEALLKMADALIENCADILTENAKDLERAKGTISDVMLDRLSFCVMENVLYVFKPCIWCKVIKKLSSTACARCTVIACT